MITPSEFIHPEDAAAQKTTTITLITVINI